MFVIKQAWCYIRNCSVAVCGSSPQDTRMQKASFACLKEKQANYRHNIESSPSNTFRGMLHCSLAF
jgi:hypothetical protein